MSESQLPERHQTDSSDQRVENASKELTRGLDHNRTQSGGILEITAPTSEGQSGHARAALANPSSPAELSPLLDLAERGTGSLVAPVASPVDSPEERDMSSEAYIAVCWGCGQHVSLPLYAAVFRCGHCGALTYDYDNLSGTAKPGERKRKRALTFVKVRDCITVAFVLLLTSVVITGGGVWSAFPVLFPTFSLWFVVSSIVTIVLYLNVVFNFICTSLMRAGPVEPVPWGDVSIVQAGSLTDCTLCTQCDPPKPKPFRAHHCRQCGDCVQDMDHHCPFIGNCVGQSNQRHFMVFLVFATTSCLYAAVVTILAFVKYMRSTDFSHVRGVMSEFASRGGTSGRFFLMLPELLWEVLVALQFRGVALLYIFGISLGTAACTAILFLQQLSFIFQGVSYIDSLKQGKALKVDETQNGSHGDDDNNISARKDKRAGALEHKLRLLRAVFGTGSVWTWLLPRVAPPPGSRAYRYKQHKQ